MSNSTENTLDGTSVQPETAALQVPATPLAATIAASSTSLVEYRGVRTPEMFSNTREELATLLSGAGVYDLGWRRFLRCAGRDRVRWLNGMVTNSVSALEENAGCYAFVLNAQGRIQGDLDIYRLGQQPETLWIETDCRQIEPLTAFLRHYIIMDQVTLDVNEAWTVLGIAGPRAGDKLAAIDLPAAGLLPLQLRETSWRGNRAVVVATYSPRVLRYEVWVETQAVLDLWNALQDALCVPCGVNATEQLRILEGRPTYGIDIGDRDLPQETNQMRALNFTKGCYLGQEIVERIRTRGNVHRTLSGFQLAGEPPSPRTALQVDGKSVGEITSTGCISIPSHGERVLALGHIRREALASKILTADGFAATPCDLPFDFAAMAVQP